MPLLFRSLRSLGKCIAACGLDDAVRMSDQPAYAPACGVIAVARLDTSYEIAKPKFLSSLDAGLIGFAFVEVPGLNIAACWADYGTHSRSAGFQPYQAFSSFFVGRARLYWFQVPRSFGQGRFSPSSDGGTIDMPAAYKRTSPIHASPSTQSWSMAAGSAKLRQLWPAKVTDGTQRGRSRGRLHRIRSATTARMRAASSGAAGPRILTSGFR